MTPINKIRRTLRFHIDGSHAAHFTEIAKRWSHIISIAGNDNDVGTYTVRHLTYRSENSNAGIQDELVKVSSAGGVHVIETLTILDPS